MKQTFVVMSTSQNFWLKSWYLKSRPTCRKQVVRPRHEAPQGQSVARPRILLLIILVKNKKNDVKETNGNMYNPMFWKKLQGSNQLESKQLQKENLQFQKV